MGTKFHGRFPARKNPRSQIEARLLGPKASAELLEKRGEVDAGLGTAESKPWEFLSGIAKDAARAWFVQRAEDRGVAWRFMVEKMQAQQQDLEAHYDRIHNESIEYPDYYTRSFHGYDEGNLSWRAAHELAPATQSMCLGYYDGMAWQDAQEEFRGGARRAIQDFWAAGADKDPETLLDLGCSGGFSSKEMSKAFPTTKVSGMDLSPYFLSVAKQCYPQIEFLHGNAESTGLPDESFDVVTLNFLLHELPLDASRKVLREASRLLKPGGVLAVLDVDPKQLSALPPFRRWAFQVTEPWCKDGEYFDLKLGPELEPLGFQDFQQIANDPVNSLALARKAL
ncbi:unnamed protein product [Effrenium voratum]|uniref:Methyltransferase type 11 domain-containing protein n=1 Tax=Effrenium voratum TaxID=2562239 RepID=A0AA36MZJ6_9DINO|nr:unnamed protein product [Effrenium voratum]CAJ1457936.1 unnamed protein product [Effrenium voratum]